MKLFRRRKTVESILAPISNIVRDLQHHADYHADLKLDHEAKAAMHTTHASLAFDEVQRAKDQAAKFASLI